MKKNGGKPRTVSIGAQYFSTLMERGAFYVDKTAFIREWWENQDDVTLITRPRRFGKTLNMTMTECFFSTKYANRPDLFEGLSIWEDETYRTMQGTWPVISLTFSSVKTNTYEKMKESVCRVLCEAAGGHRYLTGSGLLNAAEQAVFERDKKDMSEDDAAALLHNLSDFLERFHHKKVIILLDEYDAPMQDAWLYGYWDEAAAFFRGMFNAAFKDNPHLERAIITGVTRISKESLFSDLNNLKVASIMSDKYVTNFGMTEKEVFDAMDEFGYTNKDEVREWYDGFTFGSIKGIYNPWSVTNMLDEGGTVRSYWANTSSNALAGQLIREGSAQIKKDFETLLQGGTVESFINEEIVFKDMASSEASIWSILLASGYLKPVSRDGKKCTLSLTNREVTDLFEGLVSGWFQGGHTNYNEFIKALLSGDLKAMNVYMNDISLATFSSFDTGNKPSERSEPERFYHGFVLGLMADLKDRYHITSNRESGFGRYDIMLEPKDVRKDDALIMEFKVIDHEEGEAQLKDTVASALRQIKDRQYDASLIAKGIPADRIRTYGFAFEGKEVLIGRG